MACENFSLHSISNLVAQFRRPIEYPHCFVVVFLSKRLVALSFQSISHDDFGIK